MSNDELLPCPFCGGEGLEVVTGKAGQNRYKIVCSGCGVKTFETVASPLHRNAWNRRYERTCVVELIPDECGWTEWRCSACGSNDVDNYDKFCPSCGARVLPKISDSAHQYASKSGDSVRQDASKSGE